MKTVYISTTTSKSTKAISKLETPDQPEPMPGQIVRSREVQRLVRLKLFRGIDQKEIQ